MKATDASRAPMTILRICVWLVPGIILIIGFLLMVALRIEVPFQIILPVTFCAFVALGYFDMRLKLQIDRADPKPMGKGVLWWALAFAFVQIIIAPAVVFAVAYIYLTILNKEPYLP